MSKLHTKPEINVLFTIPKLIGNSRNPKDLQKHNAESLVLYCSREFVSSSGNERNDMDNTSQIDILKLFSILQWVY